MNVAKLGGDLLLLLLTLKENVGKSLVSNISGNQPYTGIILKNLNKKQECCIPFLNFPEVILLSWKQTHPKIRF
jgi:hypothetical protein